MQVAAEAPELQPPRTSLQNDVPAAEATSLDCALRISFAVCAPAGKVRNVVESKSGTVPADAEEQACGWEKPV